MGGKKGGAGGAGGDGLGRALARRQKRDRADASRANSAAIGHTRTAPQSAPLQSILDATDFEEVMESVALRESQTLDGAHPLAPPTVVVTPGVYTTPNPRAVAASAKRAGEMDRSALRIPRRPEWDPSMGREELEAKEGEAFLEWRRSTAEVEEALAEEAGFGGALLTPFEKNIHVWRQLWRVVERSDVVVQIVDARNPLLYYCPDLYRYAALEMKRTHVLLVNKADLLSAEMISRWQEYFDKEGLSVIFFSAFKASVQEETADRRVLGAEELIQKLHSFELTTPVTKEDQRVTVGFIGYPNVGKSSTINVLLETAALAEAAALEAEEGPGGLPVTEMASTVNGVFTSALKRVGVSSTPGKTKHFQTLVLSEQLMLCDCPGLVFPNFSASKSELICAGVLSIDQMRGDAVSPVAVIARRLPAALLEGVYGIRFPRDDNLGLMDGKSSTKSGHVAATTLLETHAKARGYMTDHNRPDISRSARVLLKQYVSGRILFAHAPPPASADEGEAGIGPDVFAKKGTLVRAREEASAAALSGGLNASSGAENKSGNSEARRSAPSATLGKGVNAGIQNEGASHVMARVSRGKKKGRAGQPYVRLERSYYPDPNG